ncbi:uncharacterized protein LOC125058185 [Pieris napi]|uniref:uncharacterized protein LOC125058185 n=1 Tax=Pieris napi TaxID=78633 RepID=UPI001FBAD7A0|nr:uncharacterized protein LOC125058185 [Pieris napi]
MDWSQDETFKFIELFQKERIIWDPKHKCHKNSQKVSDAWARLSEIMGRSQTELKNKKNSLMATFRQLLRRKKQSVRSVAGEDDIYKPVWLYYDAMETFLASIYECNTTVSTEERQITSDPDNVNEDSDNIDRHGNEQNNELISDNNNAQSNVQNSEKDKPANNKKIFKSPVKKKRPREDCDTEIQKNIKDTVSNLNSILLNRKETDECDMYAQLLATRLREYSKQERRQIMHRIDGLLLANPPQQLQQFNRYSRSTPSPIHSIPSSSNSPSYIPDRPTSRNNYVLRPQHSPVQISIPNTHSATATIDTVLPSQNFTILSDEITQPYASQSIIDTALINALNDKYN